MTRIKSGEKVLCRCDAELEYNSEERYWYHGDRKNAMPGTFSRCCKDGSSATPRNVQRWGR